MIFKFRYIVMKTPFPLKFGLYLIMCNIFQSGCNSPSIPVANNYGEINLSIEEYKSGVFILKIINAGNEGVYIPRLNAQKLFEYGAYGGYHLNVVPLDANAWQIMNMNRSPGLRNDDFVFLNIGQTLEYSLDIRDLKFGEEGVNSPIRLLDRAGMYELKIILAIHPNLDLSSKPKESVGELFVGITEITTSFIIQNK